MYLSIASLCESALLSFQHVGAVDLEMYRVFLYVNRLRTYRNSLLPVSRLPTEIVLRVFSLCAPQGHDEYGFSHVNLAFSQVCSRWRDIALGNPGLWNNPIVTRPRLAQEMVKRALNVPLVLVSSASLVYHRPLLMEHGHKIRSLSLTAHPSSLLDLPTSLPLLEHLVLNKFDKSGC